MTSWVEVADELTFVKTKRRPSAYIGSTSIADILDVTVLVLRRNKGYLLNIECGR